MTPELETCLNYCDRGEGDGTPYLPTLHGLIVNAISAECNALIAERDAALRALATRWYLADGTYETLPEEEVIRRRIEAAGVLKRVDDLEGFLAREQLYDHPGDAGIIAPKIIRFLKGKG